jgi:hypothetical protein
MTRNWTPLALVWLVLAIVGLVGTWYFNILSISAAGDFIGDWTGSGPAVSSLTVDLLVAAVAGCILIVVESRRLGMRFALVYIIAAAVIAFAFAFPLFLAMRERHLAAARSEVPDERSLDL